MFFAIRNKHEWCIGLRTKLMLINFVASQAGFVVYYLKATICVRAENRVSSASEHFNAVSAIIPRFKITGLSRSLARMMHAVAAIIILPSMS